MPIAEYLKQHASKDATVAVLGSEPEIYFYSGLKSATGHIYTYGLMEPQPYAATMQRQMIWEIESAKPEYIVVVNIPTSWLMRRESERLIFDWLNRYTRETYKLVGLIDIRSETSTLYHWDIQEKDRFTRSQYFLTIYGRKPASPGQ